MGNPAVGIDISMFQGAVPPGPWLFVIHKATEGTGYEDPKFAARFPVLPDLRGAYHYARPLQSDGATQANRFADVVLGEGFRPGVDMWQLDAEDGENAGVNNWSQFITDFMWTAFRRLGRRGFLYAGWPFVQSHGLQNLVKTFQWWLPDYSVNDGQVHPLQTPPEFSVFVVLHQYTSAGGLDQNVVVNFARWNALMSVTPSLKVTPQFMPPISISAVADLKCPSGGAWVLQGDGGVFAFGGAPFLGSASGKSYFAGRTAARLELERFGFLNRSFRYVIVATSGEKYRP